MTDDPALAALAIQVTALRGTSLDPSTNGLFRGAAEGRIAEVLANTDPDRAERVAKSITHYSSRASALSYIAKSLAATDQYRAAGLLAERIASSISSD